ncbi:MAG: hypothetical protein CSA65_02480 [Proteobacteria bacterium]|nr:MAG: hypothetical protein CSA65_02480 [Pseudomonadota bacterium]
MDERHEDVEALVNSARRLLANAEGVSQLLEANAQINEALALRLQTAPHPPTDSADAWLLKSQLMSELADAPAALACVELALTLAPEHAEAHYVRGTVHADLGQHELALEDLERGATLAEDDRWLLEDITFERGLLLDALGREEEAHACLREGLARFPSSELLRSGLEPLNQARQRRRLRVIEGGRQSSKRRDRDL